MTEPVTSADAEGTRRAFLRNLIRALGALWAGGFLFTSLSYLRLPTRLRPVSGGAIEVGAENELLIDEGRLITGDHTPFWIVRTANGELVALPAICTHRHCVLDWKPKTATLLCPCHGGSFDLNGNVLGGPPPRPLRTLTVTVKGGRVYVYV